MRFGRNAQSPIDDQVAEADIADRLRMANALRDKSNAGAQLENVGGQLVGSPVARALTGVVQGFEGGQERKKAYGMAEDLAASKRDRLAKALAGAGQDQTPDGIIEFGTRLLNDPSTAEVGQFYIQAGQRAKEREAARIDTQDRYKRQDELGDRRHRESQDAADARAQRAIDAADARARNAAAVKAAGGGGGGPDPYFTYQPVTDANGAVTGIARLDARGGPAAQVEIPGLGLVQRPQDNPAVQGKLAGAKQMGKLDADYWASRPAAKAARDSLITDLKALQNAPGFASIFGAVGGRTWDVMPDARDARAQLAKVVGGMSLKNRDLLEGQGAVSNFEGELLAKASTILSDTSISDELAAVEVNKIISDLETGKYAPTAPSSAAPNAPAAPPPPPSGAPRRIRLDAEGNEIP
jgi:hypothetical protein